MEVNHVFGVTVFSILEDCRLNIEEVKCVGIDMCHIHNHNLYSVIIFVQGL